MSRKKHPKKPSLPIRVRQLKVDFDKVDIPRHWFFGSGFGTHMANGLNLLFPEGEKYFIRSVQAFADQLRDPELKARVKAFTAQEVRHGLEHERYFRVLEKQGFRFGGYLKFYNWLAFDVFEKVYPRKLNLAMTAAFEHYTATFAERCLKDRYFPDHAPDVMSDLFMWHAVEEIEHKSVAYDVLQAVAPSYPLRLLGLCIATAQLAMFWQLATWNLILQDRELGPLKLAREFIGAIRDGRVFNGDYSRAFRDFASPDFHPSQIDNEGLARDALAYLERRQAFRAAPSMVAAAASPA